MEQLKLKTYYMWLKSAQNGKTPVNTLVQKHIEDVVVYGITDLGRLFVDECLNKHFNIKAITDSKVRKGNYDYRGIPVISKENLFADEIYRDDYIVVTAMTFWNEIKIELEKRGITRIISLLDLMRI